MISWMQKNNKYLVWTIWVATFAFIGAGFVGWGSYSFGSKAGNIAKVGEVEIKQAKLNSAYSNLYNQYNQMLQGQMDDKKAQELGLIQEAFKIVETQAKVLSFAKDMGIIISNNELIQKIHTIQAFQKDNTFNKDIYNGYLKSQRVTAKEFEDRLTDEMLIEKSMKLLVTKPLKLEKEIIAAAANVSDKISYKIISNSDIEFTLNEDELKKYWEENKSNFKTNTKYNLSIVWTDSSLANVTQDEIQEYYATNSFNYTDNQGKQLSLEEAKDKVTSDLKLKKSKKNAQKDYIAFKKSKAIDAKTVTLDKGDELLSKEIWSAIYSKSNGDIIKPKVIGNSYATVKIEQIILPTVKSFENAHQEVSKVFTDNRKKELLDQTVNDSVANFSNLETLKSDFISLSSGTTLEGLSKDESFEFIKQLFASSMQIDSIMLQDKVVIYSILEQKIPTITEKQIDEITNSTSSLKKSTFENNLIKELDKLYPTELFVQGLTN